MTTMKEMLLMLGALASFGMCDSSVMNDSSKTRPAEKIDHNSPKWKLREYFYSLPMQDRELIEKSPNKRIEGESADMFIFRMALKKSL